jgi:guanylate kinase
MSEAHNRSHEAVLVILAGPAGSGKSTLCERLVAEDPAFSRVVTATTRAPREGEVHGTHYHFLGTAEFDRRVAAGEFIEWAWVHQKNRYGTLAAAVLGPLAAGRSLIINIDVQGVESFRAAAAANPLLARRMVTVFINLPIPELRRRLHGRGTDGQEEIERRMRTAEQELTHLHSFDHVIESRSREEDFAALRGIVAATRQRISGTT